MIASCIPLSALSPGQCAVVVELLTVGSMRRRLLDLGLIVGTEVECLGKSPLGDPSAYGFRGAVIAIRAVDSQNIMVRLAEKEKQLWD